MSKVQVLIIGAGPTGLFMGYELARQGISFRIIDQKPEHTQHSNAMGIQTRTLEIFKQIGIVDDFFAKGQKIRSANFYDNGKQFACINLKTSIDSVFPYILTLPQNLTEEILIDHLNKTCHQVERSRELIDLTQSESGVTAIIRHADGVEETVYADWLIGCDGAHSTVREESDFSFPGDDIDSQFVVADAVMTKHLAPNEIHLFIHAGELLATFPFGDERFRIAANLKESVGKHTPSEDFIKELIDKRTKGLFCANEVSWISPFWIHSKQANHMRDGRIFIAGDASHVHSPAGGQGMNTGLQDVANLSWKLALVIKGRAKETVLNTYETERFPIIKDVVDTTERLTKMQLSKSPVMEFLRKNFFRLVSKIPAVRKKLVNRMAQLTIHYQNSDIINYQDPFSKHYPKTGMRAPDVKINANDDLYQYFANPQHQLLVFTAGNVSEKLMLLYKQLYAQISRAHKDVINFYLITPEKLDIELNQILDPNLLIHKAYHAKKPAVVLVRPDGYIGYKSHELATKPLKAHVDMYLNDITAKSIDSLSAAKQP